MCATPTPLFVVSLFAWCGRRDDIGEGRGQRKQRSPTRRVVHSYSNTKHSHDECTHVSYCSTITGSTG
jgi:hypothetical protein